VLGHRAHIPLWKLRRMERVQEKTILKQVLVSAAGEEMSRKVRVMDRGITPEKIWSLARLQKKTSGLDVIGIDYDMLVIREGMRQRRMAESEWGEQAEFMNQALECAKELDLCFVLLCQPRKVADELARGQRGPRLGEIYGSSSVENTAHVVMWIVRHYFQHEMKEQYERKATAYVLKARNDRPQTVKLEFDDEMVLFRDAAEEEKAAGSR
jgi:replicative DNA helicase